MEARAVLAMAEELTKLAGITQRAKTLVTGSKAKQLGSAATELADEALKLRNVSSAGGLWKQKSDARFNKRIHDSAERVGRAATKLKGLQKKEQRAVNLTRGGLGIITAGAAGVAGKEIEKRALLERLVRLGATDIPKTPRLLMKQRSPQELAGIQHGVQNWWGKKVTNPIMGVANKGLDKLPEGRMKRIATSGAHMVAQDPVGALASTVLPIPGSEAVYFGAKKGLEKAIDRFAPLATS